MFHGKLQPQLPVYYGKLNVIFSQCISSTPVFWQKVIRRGGQSLMKCWGSASTLFWAFLALLMCVFTGWCNNSAFLRIFCVLKDDLPLIKTFITSHVKPVSSLLSFHNTRVPLRSRAVTSSINQTDREIQQKFFFVIKSVGQTVLLLFCDSGLFALNVCVIHQECYDESACPSWSVLSSSSRFTTGVWWRCSNAKWRIHYRPDRPLFFFPLLSFMETKPVGLSRLTRWRWSVKGDVCACIVLYISPWPEHHLCCSQLAKSCIFTLNEHCN